MKWGYSDMRTIGRTQRQYSNSDRLWWLFLLPLIGAAVGFLAAILLTAIFVLTHDSSTGMGI